MIPEQLKNNGVRFILIKEKANLIPEGKIVKTLKEENLTKG